MSDETDLRELLDGVSRRAIPERDRVAAVRARQRRLHTRRIVTSTATAASVLVVAGVIGAAALRGNPPERDDVLAATATAPAATTAAALPSASCPPGQHATESVTHLRAVGGHGDPEAAARAAGLAGTFESTGTAPRVTFTQHDSSQRVVATYEVTEVSPGSWGVSTIRRPAECRDAPAPSAP